VQTFKEGMKRLKEGTLNSRLSRFLLRYRITPHSSTGVSPAQLMWGRTLRSQLDLLLPDTNRKAQQALDRQKRSHDAHATERHFNVNDAVYARNYSSGPRWLPGVVVGLRGSAMYDVQLSGNQVVRRHVDQLRSRVSSSESDSTVKDLTSGGTTTLMAEPERDGANPDCSETPPLPSPPRGMTDSPAYAPVETSSRADEPPVEQGNGDTEPSVRRLSRERHPPVCFEQQCFVVS